MSEITVTQSNQLRHAIKRLQKGEAAVATLALPPAARRELAKWLVPNMSEGVEFTLYITARKDAVYLHLSSSLDSGVQIERHWNVGVSFIGPVEREDLVQRIKAVHH